MKPLKLLIIFSSLLLLFAGCSGGGGGDSSDGGNVNTSCVDASGTWHTTWTSDPTACGEPIVQESMDHVITQSGCSIIVANVKGTFNGTVKGSSLTWTGSYPDDGGTTTSTINLTLSSNTMGGSGTWTWTDGAQSCSGTTTSINGTKTSGGGGNNGGSDTVPPSIPTNVALNVASSGQIDLSWNPSTDNAGVAGYKIHRNNVYVQTTANTSYPDTGLSPSTSYCYEISAFDAAGNESGFSDQACATTLDAAPTADKTPPSVPANLTAVAVSSSQINLYWNASTDNVGVAGYKVYDGGGELIRYTAFLSTDVSVGGLSPSTNYCYKVSAYDAAGNESGFSDQACATTLAIGSGDITPPSVPTNLTATAVSPSQINLSWSASTDDVGVVGYMVYDGGGAVIGSVPGTSTTMTGLNPSTNYCYKVSAYDAAANESALSSEACATTLAIGSGDITPPSVPTNLTATAVSPSQINLSWSASTDDVGVAGYMVYRKNVVYTVLKSVTGTSTSVTGLSPSTNYCYKVSAYDAAANESALSSEACATTGSEAQTVTLYPQYINSLQDSWYLPNLRNTAIQTDSVIVGTNWSWVNDPSGETPGFCVSNPAYASLVKFNVSTLTGKTIDSATLELTAYSLWVGYEPQNFKIGAVFTDWTPSTVTWDKVASNFKYYDNSWLTKPYPTYATQVYNIDLKPIVQNWANGSYHNNGLEFESTHYDICPLGSSSLDSYQFWPISLNVTYH